MFKTLSTYLLQTLLGPLLDASYDFYTIDVTLVDGTLTLHSLPLNRNLFVHPLYTLSQATISTLVITPSLKFHLQISGIQLTFIPSVPTSAIASGMSDSFQFDKLLLRDECESVEVTASGAVDQLMEILKGLLDNATLIVNDVRVTFGVFTLKVVALTIVEMGEDYQVMEAWDTQKDGRFAVLDGISLEYEDVNVVSLEKLWLSLDGDFIYIANFESSGTIDLLSRLHASFRSLNFQLSSPNSKSIEDETALIKVCIPIITFSPLTGVYLSQIRLHYKEVLVASLFCIRVSKSFDVNVESIQVSVPMDIFGDLGSLVATFSGDSNTTSGTDDKIEVSTKIGMVSVVQVTLVVEGLMVELFEVEYLKGLFSVQKVVGTIDAVQVIAKKVAFHSTPLADKIGDEVVGEYHDGLYKELGVSTSWSLDEDSSRESSEASSDDSIGSRKTNMTLSIDLISIECKGLEGLRRLIEQFSTNGDVVTKSIFCLGLHIQRVELEGKGHLVGLHGTISMDLLLLNIDGLKSCDDAIVLDGARVVYSMGRLTGLVNSIDLRVPLTMMSQSSVSSPRSSPIRIDIRVLNVSLKYEDKCQLRVDRVDYNRGIVTLKDMKMDLGEINMILLDHLVLKASGKVEFGDLILSCDRSEFEELQRLCHSIVKMFDQEKERGTREDSVDHNLDTFNQVDLYKFNNYLEAKGGEDEEEWMKEEEEEWFEKITLDTEGAVIIQNYLAQFTQPEEETSLDLTGNVIWKLKKNNGIIVQIHLMKLQIIILNQSYSLHIKEIEIRNGKFKKLIAYQTGDVPRVTDSNLVSLECTTVKEGEVRISLNILPIEVDLDQITVDFLTSYFARGPAVSVKGHNPTFIQYMNISAIQVTLTYPPLSHAQITLPPELLLGLPLTTLIPTLLHLYIPHILHTQIPNITKSLPLIKSLVNYSSALLLLVKKPVEQWKEGGKVFVGVRKGVEGFIEGVGGETGRLVEEVVGVEGVELVVDKVVDGAKEVVRVLMGLRGALGWVNRR